MNLLVNRPILGLMHMLLEEQKLQFRQHYHALGIPFSFLLLADPKVEQSIASLSNDLRRVNKGPTWSFEPLISNLPSDEGSAYRTQSECPDMVRTRCLERRE